MCFPDVSSMHQEIFVQKTTPKKNYIFIRLAAFSLFSIIHLLFILTVMFGPLFHMSCLAFHPLVFIHWYYLDNHCIATYIERWIHPTGFSLFGRIRWWSKVLLIFNWVFWIIFNYYYYY